MKTEFKPSQKPSQTLANPRKAVDVVAFLRWVYQDQAADAVTRRVVARLRPGGYRSNMMAVAEQGRLGVKIDCAGSAGWGRADLHPDAEAAHDVVRQLPPRLCGLVINVAKTGEPPEWLPGAVPKPVAVRRRNGKPELMYDMRGRRPLLCLLRYEPDPDHITYARRIRTEWWDALAQVVASLSDLQEHVVTGPACPREPWKPGPARLCEDGAENEAAAGDVSEATRAGR